MKFLKQISKCFARAILLENGFIIPDGKKDIIRIGDYYNIIAIDEEFFIKVEEISVVAETEENLVISVVYTAIHKGAKVFMADYVIKTNKNKCFWQSDAKGTLIEYAKVRFAKVMQMEKWANERFCNHFKETGHGKEINNKDTL